METSEKQFCPAVWFSGFFGLAALAHGLRLLFGISLVVNGYEIPMGVSAAVALVALGLSVALAFMGVQRPCCKK